MSITLNDYEKNFLKSQEKALQKNDFKTFFNALTSVNSYGYYSNIVPLFIEIGIDFWKGLDSVPKYMCKGSTALESITIPEGITRIGAEAFSDCSNLKDVVLPSTLKKIEKNAFSGSSLKSLEIPESVTSLNQGCFFGCDNIKLTTPRRGGANKLMLPKNEYDWYKDHLVFIDEE